MSRVFLALELEEQAKEPIIPCPHGVCILEGEKKMVISEYVKYRPHQRVMVLRRNEDRLERPAVLSQGKGTFEPGHGES